MRNRKVNIRRIDIIGVIADLIRNPFVSGKSFRIRCGMTALAVFLLFSTLSFAQNPGGKIGSLTWELNLSDSTLTIEGNDTMPNYFYHGYPWSVFRDSITTIAIGNDVKNIGTYAFSSYYKLTSVTIGEAVITIGEGAFNACISLTSIIIPNSVISIGGGAFNACESLSSVIIPNSVTTIENGAFCGAGLTSITIPSSIVTIGPNAFVGCEKLDTITCEANSPPILDTALSVINYPFGEISTTIPVYVPCGSIAAYQTAFGWSWFTNIQPIGGDPLPDIPENLTATQQDNIIEVSWESTNALSYEIYRNNVLLATVNTTTYNDSNVTDGVNYCYRINALSDSCVSGLNPEVCELFKEVVGIKEQQAQQASDFIIHPNPTDGRLRITHNSGINPLVEVYDIVGVNVGAYNIRPTENEIVIDIFHLSAGLYFLKIDNKTFKVVKQ